MCRQLGTGVDPCGRVQQHPARMILTTVVDNIPEFSLPFSLFRSRTSTFAPISEIKRIE